MKPYLPKAVTLVVSRELPSCVCCQCSNMKKFLMNGKLANNIVIIDNLPSLISVNVCILHVFGWTFFGKKCQQHTQDWL